MKVILIKMYGGEGDEVVRVSVVSGTPLGLRDVTVISQITDRCRAPSDHALHATFTLAGIPTHRKQPSPTRVPQHNLHLPLTLECKLPPGYITFEMRRRRRRGEEKNSVRCLLFVVFF